MNKVYMEKFLLPPLYFSQTHSMLSFFLFKNIFNKLINFFLGKINYLNICFLCNTFSTYFLLVGFFFFFIKYKNRDVNGTWHNQIENYSHSPSRRIFSHHPGHCGSLISARITPSLKRSVMFLLFSSEKKPIFFYKRK